MFNTTINILIYLVKKGPYTYFETHKREEGVCRSVMLRYLGETGVRSTLSNSHILILRACTPISIDNSINLSELKQCSN